MQFLVPRADQSKKIGIFLNEIMEINVIIIINFDFLLLACSVFISREREKITIEALSKLIQFNSI